MESGDGKNAREKREEWGENRRRGRNGNGILPVKDCQSTRRQGETGDARHSTNALDQ